MIVHDNLLLPDGSLYFEQDGKVIVLDDIDHLRNIREFESLEAAYLAAMIAKGER